MQNQVPGFTNNTYTRQLPGDRTDGRDFDWDDLRQLLNRAVVIDSDRVTTDCLRGFGFLAELAPDEQVLSSDKHQRERALAEELREAITRD